RASGARYCRSEALHVCLALRLKARAGGAHYTGVHREGKPDGGLRRSVWRVVSPPLSYSHEQRLWLYKSGGKAPHSKRFA
ncbi:MAG: hypothetical protein QOH21_2623, partial [Acidobacteriota bacterium]|nr:hypothetical protein [Acidobacteriota bacterium]